MKELAALLCDALGVLDDVGAEAALVGGLAVSVRSEPRFTRDVDLAVAVTSDEEATEVVAGFRRAGWRVDQVLEHEPTGRLATARLRPSGQPAEGRVVDLLFASSGVEAEMVRSAEVLEILPGVRARVAAVPYLLVLKLLARGDERPQDDVDLRALARVATAADLEEARSVADRVSERGFARGRDLAAGLRELVGGAAD